MARELEEKHRTDEQKRFTGNFISPLRYPGGKGRLGPWLASVIEHNGLAGGWYVEPYAGGAGAALYLLQQNLVEHIVINDADPLIYAFWYSVVNESEKFVRLIEDTPVTLETRDHCLTVISNPNQHSRLKLGFATFFLNRTNRSGILAGGVIGGKAQSGPYKLDARYNRDDLIRRVRTIGALKEQITVVGMDALDLLFDSSPGFPDKTITYLDPPYYVKGSQLYLHYYLHDDHKAIAEYAKTADFPILITYDDCPEVRQLYRGMHITEFSLHYSTHIARPVASEVLIHANVKLLSPPQLTRSIQLTSNP